MVLATCYQVNKEIAWLGNLCNQFIPSLKIPTEVYTQKKTTKYAFYDIHCINSYVRSHRINIITIPYMIWNSVAEMISHNLIPNAMTTEQIVLILSSPSVRLISS